METSVIPSQLEDGIGPDLKNLNICNVEQCDPTTFVVNGLKSFVRLVENQIVIENPPGNKMFCVVKKPLEIPINDIVSLRTRSSNLLKKSKFLTFDVNLKLRCWIMRARQSVYDRSVRYEAQPPEDGIWTPHTKEFFCWQSNISRGDTLIITYKVANGMKWSVKKLTLRHTSEEVVANWSNTLGCALEKASQDRPRKVLVFINPFGGKGLAQSIFNNNVAPLFRLAGLKYEVIITERANHARDFLRSEPLDEIDGVVCVGGDGMFSELFNGLLLRSIDKQTDGFKKDDEIESPKIRVGFIPGGSTNAVALSLHGTTDVVSAALHIILGDRRNIDVSSVRGEDDKLHRFFMAMISYGYFGDLMVHSERLRWLGPKRYDISGIHTFLNNNAYKGTIDYVEETNPGLKTDPRRVNDYCYVDCETCNAAQKEVKNRSSCRPISKSVEGNFIVVTAAVMICACQHTPRGVSPSAHLGDGQMDLILVRKTSRLNYFRYLYRTGYMNQSPFELPFVEIHRVKEFTYFPKSEDGTKSSVWNCDGEVLDDSRIRVKVHCQVLPVFARGLEKSQDD